MIAGGVALLLVAGFAAAFKYTDWGVAMRSAAEDGETASLMGIRLNRVAATAWALAGALAAIGGLFLTSFPAAGVTGGVGLVALAAIPAVVLGGFDSPGGAVVGGLIIGVVSVLTAGYQEELSFLGRGLGHRGAVRGHAARAAGAAVRALRDPRGDPCLDGRPSPSRSSSCWRRCRSTSRASGCRRRCSRWRR